VGVVASPGLGRGPPRGPAAPPPPPPPPPPRDPLYFLNSLLNLWL
jgi:hypothetical protein